MENLVSGNSGPLAFAVTYAHVQYMVMKWLYHLWSSFRSYH